MSSKQPTYPPLTRSSYEEAFLLYVDGELSPEAMAAVEAFALLHPDLQEELDALLETRLDAEAISFGDLSVLGADHMRSLSREDELLSYIDNELDAPQRAALEQDLAGDAQLRADLAAFTAAKLPAETVACPFKEELYRRAEKRRPLFWLPRVAAVLLLAGGVAGLWRMNRTGTSTSTGDAVNTPGTVATVLPAATNTAVTPAATTRGTAVQPATMGEEKLAALAQKETMHNDRISTDNRKEQTAPELAKRSTPAPVKDRGFTMPTPQPAPDATPQYAYTPDPRDRSPLVNSAGNDPKSANNTLRDPAVTSPAIAALNPQNNDAQPTATEAVYREEVRQSSVRGFLRKASRFIEKRTGIKTTNEDDQLVVGGVAINLK